MRTPSTSHARVLARLLRIAWQHRGRCFAILLVQGALLSLGVLGLGGSGLAMDVLHHALRPDAPAPHFPFGLTPPADTAPSTLIGIIAAAIVGVALVRAVLGYLYAAWVAELVQGQLVPALRSQVYEKLHALSFRFFDRQASGGLLNRITSDVQHLRSFLDGVLIQGAVVLIALGVYAAYMLHQHVGLTLACLATSPLLGVLTLRFTRAVLPAHSVVRGHMDALVLGLSESIQGIQVVKGFAAESTFLARIDAQNALVRDSQQRLFARVSRFTPTVDLLSYLNLVVLLGYGGVLVARGRITVGDLMVFAALLRQFSTYVVAMSTLVNTLQESLVGARRVFEVLDAEPDVASPERPREVPARGHVRFEGVSFGYEGDRMALSAIDFEAQPGELVALFGASGAGKSTLLSLVPRFYDVQAGRVLVDGVDVREHALASLRTRTAVVFQETFLFSNTVAANIAFGRPDASRAEIEQAAKLASAHAFVSALPGGYDTVLGEHATDLSGGQRQRLALARALLSDPHILLLDDPTAALDAETTHEILASLQTAAHGRTTLLATHRPQLLRLADQILVLDGGRIVQHGTHDALLAVDGPYRTALAPELPASEGRAAE